MAWWVSQFAVWRLVPGLLVLLSATELMAAVAFVRSAPYFGRRQSGWTSERSLRTSSGHGAEFGPSPHSQLLGLFPLVEDVARLGGRQSLHDVVKRDIPIADVDAPDYSGDTSRYDEYPVVVPNKRTAVMLDRVMVALKNVIEGERGGSSASGRPGGAGGAGSSLNTIVPDDRMDLQRRGQQKGRVYWRCYFNAVTCFRK